MENDKVELSDKEIIYAEEYLIHLNKAKAARRSGCPAKAAKEQGYEIYNRPHVKAYIKEKLKERVLSAEETVKIVSDIAQGSATDYLRPVKKVKTPKIKVSLATVIKQQQDHLEREYIFIERKGLTEKERDDYIDSLAYIEDSILKMEIELEMNPNATCIIDGDPEFVDVMELDLKALVADKEKGKVKKIKYGKDGLEFEMYSALDAAEKLMKKHGEYEKDNQQKAINLEVHVTPEEAKRIKESFENDI